MREIASSLMCSLLTRKLRNMRGGFDGFPFLESVKPCLVANEIIFSSLQKRETIKPAE